MKKRYILVSLIMTASAAATPLAIMSAYSARGYMAYGGEYLIVPLAAVISGLILDLARELDAAKAKNTLYKRKKYIERRRVIFASGLYGQRNRA